MRKDPRPFFVSRTTLECVGFQCLTFVFPVRPLLSLRFYSLSNNHQFCQKFTRKSSGSSLQKRLTTKHERMYERTPKSKLLLCDVPIRARDEGQWVLRERSATSKSQLANEPSHIACVHFDSIDMARDLRLIRERDGSMQEGATSLAERCSRIIILACILLVGSPGGEQFGEDSEARTRHKRRED